MNQITLLVLLIVTSLFLPATAIMYASGSPENNGESDSGSADDGSMDDASDDGSMDDASDDGSMDDASDSWSMEKSNNALDSGSMEMDDAPDDGSMEMDDESDTWSMEKSNNALNPEPTGGTNDGLSPLTSGPTGGTNDGLSPLTSGPTGGTNDGLSPLTSGPTGGTNDGLSPLTSGPTGGTNDGLSPLTSGPTGGTDDGLSPLTSGPTGGTDDGLSPLTSGPTPTGPNAAFRLESNITGNTTQDADFINSILAVHNRERAAVNASGSVPALVWNDTLAAGAKAWAEHLATAGLREHAPDVTENIAWGGTCYGYPGEPGYSCTPYTVIELQEGWVHEKVNWNGSTCASQHVCGHYTQMINGYSKQIGCGIASGPPSVTMGVLVCRYK